MNNLELNRLDLIPVIVIDFYSKEVVMICLYKWIMFKINSDNKILSLLQL